MSSPLAAIDAASRRFARSPLWLALGLALTQPAQAQAGDWRVQTSVRVEQTYTSNMEASEGGGSGGDDEDAGFVTEIAPGISVHRQGGRAELDLEYQPKFLIYPSESDLNRIDHTLSSRGNLEAVEDFFYVEARANVTQQFLSPVGSRPQSSSTSTDNRYTASSYSISPYIQGKLFGDNDYLLRNENIWTQTSQVSETDELSDIYTNRTTARFNTPIPTFGFSLEYDARRSDYKDQDDVDTKIARAIGHYRYDQELLVSLRTGYERNDFGSGEDSGGVWGVGLRWNPTPRTSLDGFWENHYYGGSYQAAFTHRMSRSLYRLSASRGISTFDDTLNSSFNQTWGEFARTIALAFDPTLRGAALDAVARGILADVRKNATDLVRLDSALFTEQAQIVERLDAAFIIEGARNVLTLRAFATETEAAQSGTNLILQLGSFDFGEAERITDRGVSVTWTHKVTPQANLSADVTRIYTKTHGDGGDPDTDSTQDSFLLRLTRALGPKTDGFAGLRYTNAESDNGGADYDEAAVFAGFNHRF